MGRPLRMFVPGEIYFITVRCFQRRLLLRPSALTNELVGGVLARSVRLHGIDLFVFGFASNHLHLLVRAPAGNLPRFMQHLLTNISKKTGTLVRWRGRFWERRYSAEPVLDDVALLGRVRYIIAHGVKEGLVRRCREWPGLSALRMLWTGRPRVFRWFNWTRQSMAGSSNGAGHPFDQRWSEQESLELAPLPVPGLRDLRSLRRFLRSATREIEAEAARAFASVLGVRGVLRQHPHRRARPREQTTRPPCHTSVPALLQAFRERYRSFVAAFREASEKWKRGEFGTPFPDHAFRPFVWPEGPPARLAA